ncbi:MAG: hypothetical protein QNI91_05965 [Arenicellales bacterium]|nr:hypothetical protein [Arenicellales bacterium]
MKRAHAALEAAKAYKGQGDLLNAKNMFQIVVDSSPEGTNIHHEAEIELTYYLPLMMIQRLLWDGKVEAAEKELLTLQQKFEDQPVRRQEIGRILSGLRTSDRTQNAPEETQIDEGLLMREVKKRLDGYYRQNKRYPTTRDSLAKVLPPNESPLHSFEIGRYSSDGSGYLLVLRSKQDPNHTLMLHHTGVME